MEANYLLLIKMRMQFAKCFLYLISRLSRKTIQGHPSTLLHLISKALWYKLIQYYPL